METQQEHLGTAIVGYCMMRLSTTLFHIFTRPKIWNPSTPRTEFDHSVFAVMIPVLTTAAILLWVFGIKFWIENPTHVSVVQRNNSLIGGILAVIVGLVWTCLRMPSATVRTYVFVYAVAGVFGVGFWRSGQHIVNLRTPKVVCVRDGRDPVRTV